MIVGKREFTSNPSKYFDIAKKQEVVITHRNVPELLIRKLSKGEQASALSGILARGRYRGVKQS